MRVAHLVRQFHPSVGGLEEVVAELAVNLRDHGWNSTVITIDKIFQQPELPLPAEDAHLGIPIRRLPFFGSPRYPVAASVLRHLDGFDLVHVHAVDFFCDYLAFSSPIHRKPLVLSTHGGFFHTSFAQRLKKIYFSTVTRAAVRFYDRVIAVSESDAALFAPICPGVATIENGVNLGKFRDAAAPELGKRMIFFGRFSQNKNIAGSIDLLARLEALDPGWSLTVCGRPGEVTLEELEAHAARAGVRDRVDFVIGPDNDQLAAAMGRASWFLTTSLYEGFGLTAVEAMSAGLYPLLSDIAPFRALVARTGVGLVLSGDDSARDVLATQARLAADPARARRAAMDAAQLYSWTEVSRRYAREYDEVIATRAASRAA
jgi:alpha-1,3-mannosyltransferase